MKVHCLTMKIIAIPLILLAAMWYVASDDSPRSSGGPTKVVTITGANFNQMVNQSTRPVLLDFSASWCGPCVQMESTIKQIAEQYDGRVLVGKVDVDQNRALAQKFGVTSIPSLYILEGGTVVEQWNGLSDRNTIAWKLDARL